MVAQNILLTGASGYLGGTLLARWQAAKLPAYDGLFALVRTETQAKSVTRYGAEPLFLDVKDESAVRQTVVEKGINVVFYLIDAANSEAQVYLIKALAKVRQLTGANVHFLHTSGAKIFSSHAGAPTDRPLVDTDPDLFTVQKTQKAPVPLLQTAVNTNVTVVEEAEKHGVRSYVFVPCIVYGKGEGFGNPVSIQTTAVVKAAHAMKRVYKVDEGEPTWPVCHVLDNTNLYIEILRKILDGEDPGHGKKGFFLASSGSVAWDDLYKAMAASLAKRHVIGDDSVVPASQKITQQMGEALGCPPEFVAVQIGGQCSLAAEHGMQVGWIPQYAAQHIIDTADEEVELILNNSARWMDAEDYSTPKE